MTKAADLKVALNFVTEPTLKAAKLLAEKNVIDLFETILPVDEDVYEADAPIGDYQLRVIDDMTREMLTPVIGVKFAASEAQAKVTVTRRR